MPKRRIGLCVFMLSFMVLSWQSLAVMLQGAMGQFPGVSTVAVQSVFSNTTASLFASSILAGFLSRWLRKKTLCLCGLLLLPLGAAVAWCGHAHLFALQAASLVIGAGLGTVTTLSSGLISEHFPESERGFMMGMQSVFVNGGGVLLNLLAGALVATWTWYSNYLVFLIALPVALAVALLLPGGGLDSASPTAEKKGSGLLRPTYLRLCVVAVLYSTLYSTFSTNLAFMVAEYGLGDSRLVGVLNAVFLGAAILVGLLLNRILRAARNYAVAAAVMAGAGALLMLSAAQGMPSIAVAAALLGLSFGMMNPAGFTRVSALVPRGKATLAIAFYAACMNIGVFLNPHVVTRVAVLWGGGVRTRFLVSALALSVAGGVNLLLEWRENRKPRGVPAAGGEQGGTRPSEVIHDAYLKEDIK